jgi:hypothetical protein
MVNEQNNKFDNLVVFVDNQIYARDREQGTRRARIFLINENTGDVYRRNGQTWEELEDGDYRSCIFDNICRARGNRISFDSLRE